MSETNALWEVNQEKTQPHWLEVHDPEGWYKACVRWDGCIHLNRFYNAPFAAEKARNANEEDYLHICDIDDLIARLQELKKQAIAHFGEEWGQ